MNTLLTAMGPISLVSVMLLIAAPAAAQGPAGPTLNPSKTLVRQELPGGLPDGPHCWRVVRPTLAPGARSPAADYVGGPLRLAYVLAGEQQEIEYQGGPTVLQRKGEGVFIGGDSRVARINRGTTQVQTVEFELTCGAAGGDQVARTDALVGIRPRTPYIVFLTEGRGVPGELSPVVNTGTWSETFYMLEGALARSTTEGVKLFQAGDLFTAPLERPVQYAVVGTGPALWVTATLVPMGERRVQDPPGVVLPSPFTTPTTLPRTGGPLPLIPLVAATLLAAGLLLRRPRDRCRVRAPEADQAGIAR